MTFEEVFAGLPEGWLAENEARILWLMSTAVLGGDTLEIGCYHGRSTVLLAHALASGRRLFCIDPFPDVAIFDAWRKNTQGLPIWLCAQRVEDCTLVPPEIDLAYLDGDHTFDGTCAQIRKALECKAKIIAVHDYGQSAQGDVVKEACLSMFAVPPGETAGSLAVWRTR